MILLLDALLEDLESAIPPPITCGPKPTAGAEQNEIILDIPPEINGNLVCQLLAFYNFFSF